MSHYNDFRLSSSFQIEAALGKRIESIRLSRNMTQSKLAHEAGVSLRTIGRLASGKGISLDTFIRIMTALGIQENLNVLLPDPEIKPVERVGSRKYGRKRARPVQDSEDGSKWTWGDNQDNE